MAHPDLLTLWVAPTGSITAPFVPWRMGVTSVPPEFRKHRYRTKGAATSFVTKEAALQEAAPFAGRLYKRVMYYTCSDPQTYLPEVTGALTAFEVASLADVADVEATALALHEAGEHRLAQRYLTGYSHARAGDAMDLGEALVGSLEARVRLSSEIPVVEAAPMGALDYNMVHFR